MEKSFVSLFSGAGVVDLLPKSIGYELKLAVEYDPEIANLYRQNHGDHILVQDVLNPLPVIKNLDWLHASPSCTMHSGARQKATVTTKEREKHIQLSIAIANYALQCQAKFVTIENVAEYYESDSFRALDEKMLKSHLYSSQIVKIKASNCGLPQDRDRTFAIYWRNAAAIPSVGFNQYQKRTISDVIDSDVLIKSKPSVAIDIVDNCTIDYPVLIERVGYKSKKPIYRSLDERMWTIKACIADDGKGGKGRSQFISVLYANGEVDSVTPRFLARCQGIPDSFTLGDNNRIAVRAIGNGCPPQMLERAIAKVTDFEIPIHVAEKKGRPAKSVKGTFNFQPPLLEH